MSIHLRFYRERYNMDDAYYTGDEDIYRRVRLDDLDDLRRCWDALLHDFEGETYSAWYGKSKYGCDKLLCGGAFDPGDIDIIESEYMSHGGKTK